MTRYSTKHLLILAVVASTLRASDPAAQTVYTFRSFSVCGNCLAGTGGINDEGVVAVSASASGNPLQAKGYLYNSQSGTAAGLTAGPPPLRPLIRLRDGTVQILEGFPGALLTNILEFNGRGASVGY